jgi:hypothetical protein
MPGAEPHRLATVKIPWTPNKTSYDCVPTHSEHKPDPKLLQAMKLLQAIVCEPTPGWPI